MLYESGKYDEVLDTFTQIRAANEARGTILHSTIGNLAFAACFKLVMRNTANNPNITQEIYVEFFLQNNETTFKYATELINTSKAEQNENKLSRRSLTFYAALALKQNQPDIALKVVETSKTQSYVTIRNIKVLALTQLGRYTDALALLRTAFEFTERGSAYSFCSNVVCMILYWSIFECLRLLVL